MTSQAWKISFLNFKTFQDTGEPGETEPGLVAFYNIWPGNGVDLFFQPRSLYGDCALHPSSYYYKSDRDLSRVSTRKPMVVLD